MTRKNALIACLIGIASLLCLAGSGMGIYIGFRSVTLPKPREPLSVRLDTRGPYVILATEAAEQEFAPAIRALQQMHPGATRMTFRTAKMDDMLPALRKIQPRYAAIVIKPEELDVNVAWQWLDVATRIDEDALVDVSSGFLTGASPEAAADFVDRIAKAVRGERRVPGMLVDNLGPNPQAPQTAFFHRRGCFMIPVFGERTAVTTISHGMRAFSDERLDVMQHAGLVHFGGHGYPDRIVDGMRGEQARRLQLPASVVFNGACYTGVTHRWYEQWTADGKVREQTVGRDEGFCLNLLQNGVIAYLAALHPDHGIPVYQEMEYLAYTGASLGDVMRHSHNGVILGNGGELPVLEPLAGGMPTPQWTPSDVMLNGTAARVLFGDPALVVTDRFTEPPFEVAVTPDADQLAVTATLRNTQLKSEYTDTFHADLASNKQLFNDRAFIRAELPDGWDTVADVQVVSVRAGGRDLQYRTVGHALELDGETRRLHVQVDVPTSGYMQSRLRQAGAEVVLRISR